MKIIKNGKEPDIHIPFADIFLYLDELKEIIDKKLDKKEREKFIDYMYFPVYSGWNDSMGGLQIKFVPLRGFKKEEMPKIKG